MSRDISKTVANIVALLPADGSAVDYADFYADALSNTYEGTSVIDPDNKDALMFLLRSDKHLVKAFREGDKSIGERSNVMTVARKL